MRKTVFTIITLSVVTISASINIRMGSLAPRNSPWDNALQRMRSQWSTISRGNIEITIFPGGILGDESTMIEMMRAGTLGAAAITGLGMADIFPGILAPQLPMLFRSEDEFNEVMDSLTPYFNEKFKERGFKILTWTTVGWTHFFCVNPVSTPKDLKDERFFVYAGNPDTERAWRSIGFTPVPLSVNDVLTGLQSGSVTAFASTPLSTASMQWFGRAKYMSDFQWSPLLGGIIISTDIWNKIPRQMQAVLKATTARIGADMGRDIQKTELEAIAVMEEYGLQRVPISKDELQKWIEIAPKAYKPVVGQVIDQESYDMVITTLNSIRDLKK